MYMCANAFVTNHLYSSNDKTKSVVLSLHNYWQLILRQLFAYIAFYLVSSFCSIVQYMFYTLTCIIAEPFYFITEHVFQINKSIRCFTAYVGQFLLPFFSIFPGIVFYIFSYFS